MAVVTGKSDLIHDPFDPASIPPDTQQLEGVMRTARFTVANAAADSALSKYLLARVPSDAIMDETTQFQVQNWGFAQIQIGTKSNATALVNVLKSAGNVVTPFVFGDANHGKRLWGVLGLANDPGGQIDLYAHALANATGAGSMKGRLSWMR